MTPTLPTRAALAFVLLLPAAMAWAAEPAEPTYRERSAAQWAPLLRDRDDETRLTAITALVAIGKDTNPAPFVSLVTPLLDDAVPLIRSRACLWLAKVTKDAKVVKVAAAIVASGSTLPAHQVDAALALEAMGPAAREALPDVEKAIAKIDGQRVDVTTDSSTARVYRSLVAARKAIAAP